MTEESSNERKARQARLRLMVIKEILSTETSYVESLTIMNTLFIEPLKKNKYISEQKSNMLFSNLPMLCTLHSSFLSDLQAAYSKIPQPGDGEEAKDEIPDISFGPEFKRFVPYFKLYTEYVNNYDVANNLLSTKLFNQKNSKYKKFRTFVTQTEKIPDCKNQQLISLLIMPIQRLPRYKLLLAELLKRTAHENPGRTNLVAAFNKVAEVAKFINEAKRKEEGASRSIEIQKNFGSEVAKKLQLLQPDRYFVKQGIVSTQDHGKTELILFNDLLLLCKERKQGEQKLELLSRIALTENMSLAMNSEESLTIVKHAPVANYKRSKKRMSVLKPSTVDSKDGNPRAIDAVKMRTTNKDLTLTCESRLDALEWIDNFVSHCLLDDGARGYALVRAVSEDTPGSRAFALHLVAAAEEDTVELDVNVRDPATGRTSLMIACKSDDVELVTVLLNAKTIDVNATDEDGETALLLAGEKTVLLLVQHPSTDLSVQSNLKISVWSKHKTLLGDEADRIVHQFINGDRSGPKIMGAVKLILQTFPAIMELGIDEDASLTMTAVKKACRATKTDAQDEALAVIRVLIQANVDLLSVYPDASNATDETPLMYAARHSDVVCLEILEHAELSKGALEQTDSTGATVLLLAAMNMEFTEREETLVKRLVELEAQITGAIVEACEGGSCIASVYAYFHSQDAYLALLKERLKLAASELKKNQQVVSRVSQVNEDALSMKIPVSMAKAVKITPAVREVKEPEKVPEEKKDEPQNGCVVM